MVFQMLLCRECYENYRSGCWTMDSLYAFKCKRFSNIRHIVTFAIPLQNTFLNTCTITQLNRIIHSESRKSNYHFQLLVNELNSLNWEHLGRIALRKCWEFDN
jgi:hypothetical protein